MRFFDFGKQAQTMLIGNNALTSDLASELWNFDDPARPGRDASPNHFDGEIKGSTRVAVAPIPSAEDLGNPTLLVGKVTDAKGELINAGVTVEQEGQPPLKLREFASLFGKVVAFDQTPLEAVVVQALGRLGLVTPESGFVGEYFQLGPEVQVPPGKFPDVAADQVPDLVETNAVIDFDGARRPAAKGRLFTTNFFARWTGTIRLAKEQKITFKLRADDTAVLSVDGQSVVTTDYTKSEAQTGSRSLSAGEHTLKLEYCQGGGAFHCRLQREGEDLPPAPDLEANTLQLAAMTDAEGVYRFGELAPGPYQVRAQVPGGFVYATNFLTNDRPPAMATNGAVAGRDRFVVRANAETRDIDLQIAPFKKGNWKTYTRMDGLAHDQVVDIHETKDGVMWFATYGGGVSRWDGRQFVNYTKADGLVSDAVWKVAEDKTGALWFTTFNFGVSRWDGKKFQTFTDKDGLASTNMGSAIFADQDGGVWFGTDRGASSWDGQRFTTYTKTNGLPDNNVYAITQTKDGKTGLELAERLQPRAITLDVMMPGMDEFRRHPEWRDIPVIVVTAKELTAEDRDRLNGCVVRILEKGAVSSQQLLAEIQDVMKVAAKG